MNSRIILSGDPKQLDAVTKSSYAKASSFNTSLMERLSKLPAFDVSYPGSQCVITHLVENYRSHPDILRIPNMLFYKNKLKAKASKGLREMHYSITKEKVLQ